MEHWELYFADNSKNFIILFAIHISLILISEVEEVEYQADGRLSLPKSSSYEWKKRWILIYKLNANNSCWLRKREKGREESGLFFVSLRPFVSINIPSCQYKRKVDVLPEETCCGLALWSWKSHLAYFELFWSFEICAGSMTRSLRSHPTALLYDLCNFHLEVINELIKEMK